MKEDNKKTKYRKKKKKKNEINQKINKNFKKR